MGEDDLLLILPRIMKAVPINFGVVDLEYEFYLSAAQTATFKSKFQTRMKQHHNCVQDSLPPLVP